jgi:hypothetical protein
MSGHRELSERESRLKTIVEGAFPPFRCVAEFAWYGDKLRFSIFDAANQNIYESAGIPIGKLRANQALKDFLEDIRKILEARGHQLAPWSLD